MLGRRKREAWVFVKGDENTPPTGAMVELVERRQTYRAGPNGGSGGPYAWAVFPETPYGAYTVRVTYPDGRRAQARLTVDAAANSVTVEDGRQKVKGKRQKVIPTAPDHAAKSRAVGSVWAASSIHCQPQRERTRSGSASHSANTPWTAATFSSRVA